MTGEAPAAPPKDWWLRLGHDLRGPIAPIRMAVQMLRMGSMPAAGKTETLQMIDRQVDLLLANIEAMSELLRINAGTSEFHPVRVDLGDCFELLEGHSLLMRELKQSGVSLVTIPWPSPLIVMHDPQPMVSVLDFLVSRFARRPVRDLALRLSLRREQDLAVWSIESNATALSDDTELQYVLGNSLAVNECEGKAVLAREWVRLLGLKFLPMDPQDGLAFSLPIEP